MTNPSPALRSAIEQATDKIVEVSGTMTVEYSEDFRKEVTAILNECFLAPAPVEQARGEPDDKAMLDVIKEIRAMTGWQGDMDYKHTELSAVRLLERLLAHFQSLATENKDRDWALAKEACRRVIHAIGRDHDVGSTGALAIEAIGKAFPEFAARASTGKGDGK